MGREDREQWEKYTVRDDVPMFVAWFLDFYSWDANNLFYILEKPWKYTDLFTEYEDYRRKEDEEYFEENPSHRK